MGDGGEEEEEEVRRHAEIRHQQGLPAPLPCSLLRRRTSGEVGRKRHGGFLVFLFEDCPNCAETKDDEVGLRLMWRACRRGEQLRIVRVNLIYTFTSASRIVVFNVCVP